MFYRPSYKPQGSFGIQTGYPFGASANQALGQIGAELVKQPAQMAGAIAGMQGQYGQNLQQGLSGGYGAMAGGLGNAYGAYVQGLGNMATAQANERSNMYGAAGMAEAARQGALGNIGSAALGAYGSAGNSALAAYAQQQQAYQQAMSQLGQSNQQALSGYGQSRNTALGQLAASYPGVAESVAGLGKGQMAANMAGQIMGGGGSSFSAAGPQGEIASGSYTPASDGGLYGGGGSALADTLPYVTAAYGGLDATRRDLMSQDMPEYMMRGYADSSRRLTDANAASSGMPRGMLRDVLSGLTAMGNQAYDASGGGMSQFYNSLRPGDYAPLASAMGSGYSDAANRLTGGYADMASRLGSGLTANYQDAANRASGLYNQSLAPVFDVIQQGMRTDQRMKDRNARLASGTRKTPTFGPDWVYSAGRN